MNTTSRMGSSWPVTVTIILVAEVFTADLVLPLGLAVWLPYAALVLISLWVPYRQSTLVIATVCTGLITLGFFLSPLAWATPSHSLFNRALGVVVIWVTALLCLQRKRAEETQQALYHLSVQLSRSLNLQEVFPVFGAAVRVHLPYDRIGVVVPQGESLVVALSVAVPPLSSSQGMTWPQAEQTAVGWVLAHQAPRLVRDLGAEQAYADEAFLHQEGVRATLMLPLLGGGEAFGVFLVDSRTPGTYTERHLRLLGPLAEQLALAVQNARLYDEAKGHAEELERRVEERTRQLQEANLQLEAASRHKSAFLANMSHELRTPLNSILGFAEVLQQQAYGALTAEQELYVDNIHNSGKHLLALISDLLDLARVEAGRIELCPQPFVLFEALQAALNTVRRQAETKSLRLSLSVDADLSTLTADPIRFNQILYNLLSNAVKFTPAGGSVTVTARRVRRSQFTVDDEPTPLGKLSTMNADPRREFVEISVQDTGIGIKPEDLRRLFQRFTQLEPTLAKRHQGVGLGLALTKQLVELHGGQIWATSEGEGQGSIFTVRLPMAEPRDTPLLLVVDDDERLLETIRDALEGVGYRVKTAGDGAAALVQVDVDRPDLMILDLRLPKVDGWEVLRRLRAGSDTLELPVLAITGMEAERGDQAIAAGAKEFLTKPFSLTVLEATVRRILQLGAPEERWRERERHRLSLARRPTIGAVAPAGARVLVVEDNTRGRQLVVAILAAAGYSVLEAEDGVGLLERVRRERPDLILLDLQLPGVDGLTLARQLRADPDTQRIPLLATTAYAHPEDQARALEVGFDGYLTKPLDTEELV